MSERKSVCISAQGAQYIENGQAWMFRNNLVSVQDGTKDGDIVEIHTEEGRYLATGFYSSVSHIVVRILTHDPQEVVGEAFFRKRIAFALEYRKTLEPDNLDNCRLIYGESDQMPGLVVDRYNDLLVTQITVFGMEQRKDMIYRLLLEELQKSGENVTRVYERNDLKAREKEGLKECKGFVIGSGDTHTIISENGLKLEVDVENGQKTGWFLDQKRNRLLVRSMSANKRVLDCFSHTGGFALNAAMGKASFVRAVDVSGTALAQGHANAVLNHLEERMEFTQADVFEYLDTLKEGEFDIIVLDPPAFTKSRKTVMKAYNGYKRINRQAMQALEHGGYLVTCSCSRFMETDSFEKMLREASVEAKVLLKQVSLSQQNVDHPILWHNDETSYLKFYVFQVIKDR